MLAAQILNKYWGYTSFRPFQQSIIESVMEGKDVVALLPTGGGKSICYQVPSLMLEGVTVVISPLISLMEDQVGRLKRLGIKAECIHSGKSYKDVDRILDNCIYGDVRLVYVSPERLSNELFLARIKQAKVSLLAIDEAHCISQWGHDFRPSYLNIHEFKKSLPGVPLLALTATATQEVIEEIKKYLHISSAHVFRDSFLRKNIFIDVREEEDGINEIKRICRLRKGKKIIYVRSRRLVKMIAALLKNQNLSADYYHAGLNYHDKQKIQEGFQNGKLDVIVATNAFGMGIDVPDVRHVIHYGLPSSLEEYYQEIGRAGRDGESSGAHLLYAQKDISRLNDDYNIDYPEFEKLTSFAKLLYVMYNIAIGSGKGTMLPFKLQDISKRIKVKSRMANGYLHAMERMGFINITEEFRTRDFVKIAISPRILRKMLSSTPDDPLIEYIIRTYPGVFEDWIEIDLDKFSRKHKWSREKITLGMKNWKDKRALKYYCQKSGSKIIFLKEREPKDVFRTYRSSYEHLRKLKLKRSVSVLDYLKTDSCRSRVLLKYFNEDIKADCLNCDNCNKDPLEITDFQLTQLDAPGIVSIFQLARKSNDTRLLERIQKLNEEGLIELPSQIIPR